VRVGLLGGGVIARLFLEQRGDAEIVAIAGRSEASRGKALAREFGVPFVVGVERLAAARPEIVIEAASHDAVRESVEALLTKGIAVIVLSGGALADAPTASITPSRMRMPASGSSVAGVKARATWRRAVAMDEEVS